MALTKREASQYELEAQASESLFPEKIRLRVELVLVQLQNLRVGFELNLALSS